MAWLGRGSSASEAMRAITGTCFAVGEQKKRAAANAHAPSAGRAREALEENMQRLFHLHDLRGCGQISPDDLIELNLRISHLHYGPNLDQDAVRKKYETLFHEHLDPSGRPISYPIFRDYMCYVLHEHDDDVIAQTMILEQFIVEAESALTIFPYDPTPTASTSADDITASLSFDEEMSGTGSYRQAPQLPACDDLLPAPPATRDTSHTLRNDYPSPARGDDPVLSELPAVGNVVMPLDLSRPRVIPPPEPKTPVMAAKRLSSFSEPEPVVMSTRAPPPPNPPPAVRPQIRLQAYERFKPASPSVRTLPVQQSPSKPERSRSIQRHLNAESFQLRLPAASCSPVTKENSIRQWRQVPGTGISAISEFGCDHHRQQRAPCQGR